MLTDTGPLLALFDEGDSYHAACHAVVRSLPPGPLLTTWPCFTEAMYLLNGLGGYHFQESLWTMRRQGRLLLMDLTSTEVDRVDALMARYHNVPMDLADASLVAIAESRGIRRLFAIDSDFYIYRLADGSVLELVR